MWWGFLSRVGFCAGALVALTGLFFLFYLALGVHPNFLRSESGLLLELADSGRFHDFAEHFTVRAYNGHYTPVAFWLEYQQAGLLRLNETAWLIRNASVSAILTGSIALFIASLWASRTIWAWVIGLATGLVVVCQPAMTELLNWPFMALQALCMSMAYLAGASLVWGSRAERVTWATIAPPLVFGYGSMHLFGAGLPASLGIISACVVMIWLRRKDIDRSWLTVALIGLTLALTLGHAWLMLQSEFDRPAAGGLDILNAVLRIGTLTSEMLRSSLVGLFSSQFQMPNVAAFPVQGVYGLGIWAVWLALVVAMIIRARSDRWTVGPACLAVAVTVSMAVMLGSIAIRIRAEPDAAMLNYIVGTRYFLFVGMFAVMGLGAVVSRSWLAGPQRLSAGLGIAVAVTSIAASVVFWRAYAEQLWPHTLRSTPAYWNDALGKVKAQLDAGRPAPLVEMQPITEAPNTIKDYSGIVRRELGMSKDAPINWAQ